MNATYKTQWIRDLISKETSVREFSREVKKRTGINDATIRTHLNGQCRPSMEELKVFSSMLDIDIKRLLKTYRMEDAIAEGNSKEGKCMAGKTTKVFNYKKLEEAVKAANLSKNKVCAILGISSSSFRHWETAKYGPNTKVLRRLCDLLNINVDDLYTETAVEANPQKETKNTASEKAKADKTADVDGFEFNTINTQNIHEIFNIINNNILTLSRAASYSNKNTYEDIKKCEEKIDALSGKVDVLITELREHFAAINDPEKKIMPIAKAEKPAPKASVAPITVKKEIKAVNIDPNSSKIKDECKKLINGYTVLDNFEQYRTKINRMVSLITFKTKDTHKQTLHQFYEELNRVYGVVYDQLKKEYIAKYHKKNTGTTELIYENEIFREIFYNLVAGRLTSIMAA